VTRAVVIGAGVVGAALADELSRRGWTDVTVVEQGPLWEAGGSSSHAPGLVFQANGSKTMTEFATYTVEKLCGLELDGQPCFLQVGGLEVATTRARLRDLYRRKGWLAAWGVAARILSPDECVESFPLLDRDRVLGGLLVPTDGIAKAVRAIEAQGRAAQDRGVRFLANTEVTGVAVEDGRVTGVVTDGGELAADVVVCCAGIWGPQVAAMVGMTLPLTPLAHQLAWTGPIPALAGQAEEITHPILRHQDNDLYYREIEDRLAIGFYGHDPMPVDASDVPRHGRSHQTPIAEMPSVLDFTPADFDPAWEESRRLLPGLTDADITAGINGLFSFTPDGFPLMGESATVSGFWVAEAVWVTHSAGVARAMAEWLVDGASSVDLHECDVNRFEPHQLAPEYVLARDCQNFVEVYDIIHPLQPMEHPRPLRTTPFYPRQVELGAVFLEASGWERPQWYAANAGLVDDRGIITPNDWAARYWSPIVAAEAQVTRERVAMYDMTALKRLEVSGPGATDFLQYVTTGNVDKSVGSITYCLLLDERGRVHSDVTVARLGPQRFQVGANGEIDRDWLGRLAPKDGSVSVRDLTPGTCCVGLWGPQARDVLQSLTGDDFSNSANRYFRAKSTYLGMVPVTAMRLSYVGELGWEIYTSSDLGLKLWDTLWTAGADHGIIAAGRGAFTSLRLEKGYRSFGADMTWDHLPAEAGLDFAVRMDKADFIGKAALEKAAANPNGGPARRLVCLTVDRDDQVVMGKEPVLSDGRCVGYVTSAGYGYTVGRGIAYAWLPSELSDIGTEVTIGYFDQSVTAVVTAEPLVDPGMQRLRS
jgi:glycine cleavage system aminomethyltransferase T/glycine/D-amino acid oxidase-like deaminating enzyme